jgi:hypothetical protein
LGKAYGDIMNYLSKIGVQPSGTPYVGYFNTDMQDLDIECGLPVAQPVAGTNELKPSEIPAGKQVSCLYTGPYNQIESAYNAIMEWIPANGYTPTGVCYEFYLNNPGCWIGLFFGLAGRGGEGGIGLACASIASLCHRASLFKASSCSRCPALALHSARPRVV